MTTDRYRSVQSAPAIAYVLNDSADETVSTGTTAIEMCMKKEVSRSAPDKKGRFPALFELIWRID